MTEEELKASQIHDLVEDRLLIDYRQLPELATQAHQACLDWVEANARLEAAGNA
jgi:Rop-like